MENEEIHFSDVVDTLYTTFSGVIGKDVIETVVESYDGDLNQSANALMSISSDVSPTNFGPPLPTPSGLQMNPQHQINNMTTTIAPQNGIPYAQVSQQRPPGMQLNSPSPLIKESKNMSSYPEIQEIINQYNYGWRVLIIMRGPPGCGKTHLARDILQCTTGSKQKQDLDRHILSTDDFFMSRGVYVFDKFKLQEAHSWNQQRARYATSQGISPIIIDNTNILIWEMEPYVRLAVANGYVIHVIDPKTPWARNAYQLFKRNNHNVPLHSIKRMLENKQEVVSGEVLVKKLGLHYPTDFNPPVLRKYPDFIQLITSPTINTNNERETVSVAITNVQQDFQTQNNKTYPDGVTQSYNESSSYKQGMSWKEDKVDIENSPQLTPNVKQYEEVQVCLEEFEKLETAWDNGEKWDEDTQKPSTSNLTCSSEPLTARPPRSKEIQEPKEEKPIIPIDYFNDWRKYLPPLTDPQYPVPEKMSPVIIEMKSIGTIIENGDIYFNSNLNSSYKILTTIPRNINTDVIQKQEKIPDKRMFDKSTSTYNEEISMQPFRCQNEEQHFKAFRRMFKNISKSDLRDVFENCCGDVNWAVEIVIDGMTNKQFGLVEENISDDEGGTESPDRCECLAAYNIIPDIRPVNEKVDTVLKKITNQNMTIAASPRRVRKEITKSEVSLKMKRQIEENIVIGENHYSESHLKVRNWRRGNHGNKIESLKTDTSEINLPSTSDAIINMPHEGSDDEASSCASDVEKTVNVNIGMEFIKELDRLFGRDDMKYPDNIVPNINVPMSILNEINALWMESLMHQLEEESKQTEVMIEQDAEFARLLVAKEEEMLLSGKEPDIPDFKEIMDMDLALSLYQKEVAEWRNKEPLDLAAKMTRDKLYNLFPDIAPEILSELLMAHDNNFQNTVEVLLISTGRSDILEVKNGVNKFVMEKEMQRKMRFIEEKKKALSEVEWPFLPSDTKLTMADVNHFRAEAANHLDLRQKNYNKARDYINRGLLSVASYYSELSAYHTMLYEQASSKAANALVHVNSRRMKDNSTIDLHSMRVLEAIESLDLFLDIHIRKLKDLNGRNGVRSQVLYLITGRGKHSPAGPRIKPAVKKRLFERGFYNYELNPGLLTATVTANHKLSDEIA
ncbi:unnamed protein product [Leptosia nina]|uniref:Smr domain-containing protein n=1 Tax=Leptosia nina TaxID=320188 RepID=A0AAV1K3C4_9NEOP